MEHQSYGHRTLFHLDRTNLLLNPRLWELTGIQCLKAHELKRKSLIKKHFSSIFALPLFKRFGTLSIATLDIDFEVNALRYENRTGKSFDFDKNKKKVYMQIMHLWHRQVSSLSTVVDNLIVEDNEHYIIRPKQSKAESRRLFNFFCNQ